MATDFDLDHAYLHDVVSVPLTEAMAQLAILQPKDPVDFLGHFLLKHAANAEAQQRLKNLEKQSTLITPLDLSEAHMKGGNRQHQELEWKRMCDEENELQVQLLDEPSVARMVQKFSEWLCLSLHAEEAYIGRKCVNAEGNTIVHFIASSKHRKSAVVDRFVTQPADNEETNRRGDGVTFDAFKEIAPTDGNGDAAIDGEGNAFPAVPPPFVHVENVLREPRVKFFGIPKLGALVMRAGQYKSYLHADVYNESNAEEPNVLEQWLVFSVDTMGQARTFTKIEIDRFRHATELFLTTLEEKERSLYIKDNERQSSSDEPLLKEFSVAFSAQVADQEEKLATLLPTPAEGEELHEASLQQRATKESEFRLSFLTTLLVAHISTISIMSTRVVPFKGSVLLTFAAALELLSYKHTELYSPATGQPRWNQISLLLGEDILAPSLKAFEASLMTIKSLAEADSTSANGLRAIRDALLATPAAVSLAKQTLSDISKTDVDAASPVASCLYVWSLAAIAYAESLTAMIEYAQDQAAAAEDD